MQQELSNASSLLQLNLRLRRPQHLPDGSKKWVVMKKMVMRIVKKMRMRMMKKMRMMSCVILSGIMRLILKVKTISIDEVLVYIASFCSFRCEMMMMMMMVIVIVTC